MFRTLNSLIEGRRVRPEVVSTDQHGEHRDSSLAPAQEEGDAAQLHTGSSIVHVVPIDPSPASEALGKTRSELREGGESINSEHNAEWVEVDLSIQNLVSNEVDNVMTQVSIVPSNNGMNDGMGAEVSIRRTSSTSHIQDTSSMDNTGTAIESCTAESVVTDSGQQELENPTNLQVPLEGGVLQNGLPHSGMVASTVSFPQQQGSRDVWKTHEGGYACMNIGAVPRSVSAFSTDSLAECCRICQQPTDEPLMELGCQCRGDLAKAHRSCIQQWFNNKGSNKCEICQHVATNLPPPTSQPLQNFWVWRMNRTYGGHGSRRQGRGRFHPLWAALLILVAGLLFDVLISYYLGASALPVNIIIGVLVVLGLGTAARLIVECWHERSTRRSSRRMEMASDADNLQTSNTLISIHLSS